MATAEATVLTDSDYTGSEEVFDVTCTPCGHEGKHVEAVNFCADCSEYFCEACTSYHQKFGATSGHIVVKTDQADHSSSVLLPTERCREHVGERISTYCAEHDVVVCSTCVALEHRLCNGVNYIPKIVEGLKRLAQTEDRTNVHSDISNAIVAMNKAKLKIQDRQTKLDADKKRHLIQIKTFTDSMMEHIRCLERAAVTNVDDHYDTISSGLISDMDSVNDITSTMKDRLEKIKITHVDSDGQLFVDIKQGQKAVSTANKLIKRLKSSDQGRAKTIFACDDSVISFLKNVNSLGKIIPIKPYRAVLKGAINVDLDKDKCYSDITDTCILPDRKLLMTDNANECIKVLDSSNKVSKSFKLPSRPWGICQTNPETVAVTLLDDKKVQFLNIKDRWKLIQSFKVDDRCRGIVHFNGELLVSFGGHQGTINSTPEGPGFVGFYNMSGTLIRKIQFDSHGDRIFSVPRHIATTKQGTKLHIADGKRGVITVDIYGNMLWTFAENLKMACGICAVSDDSIVIGGRVSQNVLQIDTSGNLVTGLLNHKDALGKLFSLTYAYNSSMLILTFADTAEIKVFDMVSD